MSGECDKCGDHALECKCDPISKMAHQILKERDNIIDLFCKTFFVSQEPRSLEELRALFEICELEVTHHSHIKQTFRIKLKNEGGFCGNCKNELVACVYYCVTPPPPTVTTLKEKR